LPVVFLVIILSSFFFLLSSSFWGRGERLGLSYINTSGDIAVTNFDPKLGTIATVVIPKDTEVEVSRSLGKWRIGVLYQLGENEKLGGVLLSETITRYFKMPSDRWASGEISFSTMFSSLKTNLSVADRVSISVFPFFVKSGSKISINAADVQYVKKSKLSDGKLGYIRAFEKLPFEISTIFADPDISTEALTIQIENRSGKKALASDLGEIIEVMGAKIFSLQAGDKIDSDCIIYGKRSVTRDRLSRVFTCKTSDKLKGQGNFDLVIQIGTGFARRY
ncbi:MAG: hypothetical protein AAB656_00725, partial [Patescibacteria group bacterium]